MVDDVIKSPGSFDLQRIDFVAVCPKIMNEVGLRLIFLIGDKNGSVSILNNCALLLHFNFLLPVGYN